MTDGEGRATRCFVAVELSAEVRQSAAGAQSALRDRLARDSARSLRFVRAEALHVTMRFLGHVESEHLPEVADAIRAGLADAAPAELETGPLFAMPGERRPRVVALEVGPEEGLAGLAGRVERAARAAGLPAETRRFRAHLTLARVARGARVRLPELASIASPRTSMTVEELVLFRSELDARGPRYTALERFPLGNRAERLSGHPESRTLSTNQN